MADLQGSIIVLNLYDIAEEIRLSDLPASHWRYATLANIQVVHAGARAV